MRPLSTIPFIAQSGSTQNWLQLIMLLVVFGGSFLSWMAKKLSEKAEQKRRQDALERRQAEALRTGRPVPEAAPAAAPETDRQRELAARRQAQLQELRRRQQERARKGAATGRPAGPTPPAMPQRPQAGVRAPRGPAPGSPIPQRRTGRGEDRGAPPPLVVIPGSSGPIVVGRVPSPRSPAPAPASRPQRAVQRRGVQRAAAPPSLESVRPAPQRFTELSEAAPALQTQVVSPPSPVISGVPRSPQDWRRAILAREILSPPLALRRGDTLDIPLI
jgi:hypothetical protein